MGVDDFTKMGRGLAEKAPVLFALLFICGGFLWFQDRQENRWLAHDEQRYERDMERERTNTAISLTRINECHDVQRDSIEVHKQSMQAQESLSKVLHEHTRALEVAEDSRKDALTRLISAIERLENSR
jgi:hypothetical protein